MTGSRFIILGGGMVAGYAAKQLVELGLKPGQLAIVSADTSIPYERPRCRKASSPGKRPRKPFALTPRVFTASTESMSS